MPRYRFTCTDKITGRTMLLCAEGATEEAASSKIWDIGFLISKSVPCPWVKDPTLKHEMEPAEWDEWNAEPAYSTMSSSKKRLVGKVAALSWDEDDTDALLKLYNTECDLNDRHMYLNQLVRIAERGKADPLFCSMLEMYCWQWVVERNEIADCIIEGLLPALKREYIYEVGALKRLRIMIDDLERSAQVCDLAINMKYPPQDVGRFMHFAEKYRKQAASYSR